MQLSDRDTPRYPKGSPAVHSLIPLPELLSELFNVGPASKKVAGVYGKLINTFGSEFELLLNVPVSDIQAASPMLAEAVQRVRKNRVIRKPGFDGEFGVIKVFSDEERACLGGQLNLFGVTPSRPRKKKVKTKPIFSVKSKYNISRPSAQLNPEQQAAVNSSAECILVTAGPGTGKTFTLVQRVVRLLGEQQKKITVITFTNKAADEIRHRLAGVDGSSRRVRVDTFHGYCLHWLFHHNPELRIAGPEMRNRLFGRLYPDLSGLERKKKQRQAALFLASQPLLPKTVPEDLQPFFSYLRVHNLLDLDEVIPACNTLLHKDTNFAVLLQAAAGHLLIDEFQDLNAAQYELVRLQAKTCSIFAIGDPDQAIYGFRGSTPEWFHRFIEFQKPEQHFLLTNYRNGSSILEAAGRVISTNHDLDKRKVTAATVNSRGIIYHHLAENPTAEARFTADQIQHLLGGTSHREIDHIGGDGSSLALSDIAVLYRTGKQASVLARAMEERSIPCQVVDVEPFYRKGDAKIIYYWILLAAGIIDKAELLFLLGCEHGIGSKTVAAAEQIVADDSRVPMTELVENRNVLPTLLQQTVPAFVELDKQLVQTAGSKSVAACIDLLSARYGMDQKDPDLVHMKQLAASAVSLSTFADYLRRYQAGIVYDERAEAVLLSTLHAAKGLEFKAVFIVGCDEGLLPMTLRVPRESDSDEQIQEERRLFFVGMTRAAQVLYLTTTMERQVFSGWEKSTPSRFLTQIPEHLLNVAPEFNKKVSRKHKVKQLRLF
jgi:superfamily I DNA/RNA helicase